jgi:hypothetical protein
MGAHLSLSAWSIPVDQSPNWEAANEAIEAISVEEVAESMADLLADVPELSDSINAYEVEDPCNLQAMPLVKEQLRKDVVTVREALEAKFLPELLSRYELGGQWLYVTGGLAYSVEPLYPLHGAMQRLEAAPMEKTVAEAIGFGFGR